MSKPLKTRAGATGLEPATFGVTGRRFINKINGPSDSAPDISGPKPGFPTPELESFSRVICRFSCGACSAVATKMALKKYGARVEKKIAKG